MNKLSKILLVIIILLVIALGIAIYSSHKNLQKFLESNKEILQIVEAVNKAGYSISNAEDGSSCYLVKTEPEMPGEV